MANDQNLIWIDLEMTGLKPDEDVIIEIATVVTDSDLSIVADGPELAVHQDAAALARMDEWNSMRWRGARRCVATASVRIGAFWQDTCQSSSASFITAILMSVRSRNWRVAGFQASLPVSPSRAHTWRAPTSMNRSRNCATTARICCVQL